MKLSAVRDGDKRHLAEEYRDAQDRGEIGKAGNSSNREELTSVADIGLSHKDIHEARTGPYVFVGRIEGRKIRDNHEIAYFRQCAGI